MVEKLNPKGSKEQSHQRTEVRLAKNLKDARDLAKRTGGTLTIREDTPWTIRYKGGSNILWAGYPNRQPDIHEATPYLNNSAPKHFNGCLGVTVAILENKSVTFISPGFGHDDKIFGCTFSEGQIREFEIPISEADRNQVQAREMARRESQRFMNHPTPKTVRIKRS